MNIFVDIRTKRNRSCEDERSSAPETTTTPSPGNISPLTRLIIKVGNNPGDETNDWVKVHFRNKKGEHCKTLDLNYVANGYNFNHVGEIVTIDADINAYISRESLAQCLSGPFRPDEELWMKVGLTRPATSLWFWDGVVLSGVQAFFGDDVWLSDEIVVCQSDPCPWFQLQLKN